MNKKALLLAALIVVSLGSIYFTTFRGMPDLDREPYKKLGKRMAEETIKLLGPNKRVSVIINHEFGAFKIPNLEIEMEAFTTALKEKGIAVEWGPEVYGYGRREFAIKDCNGYLLTFSAPTSDPPTD